MKFKYLLATSVAGLSVAAAVPAAAQSTGSVDFDDDIIVVSGTRTSEVGGVEIPDTPKAKQVLGEEIIRRQRPGQTANDIINLVPGVSFQNNDPWGSSGGSFTIRGFSSDRVSQTLDGLPLNDSGNYALYTNQQIDPEILANINVNLGVTDVDSPTASATGGTVNLRSKTPDEEFGITATMSYGDIIADGRQRSRPYMRGFAMIDTGDFTGMGTKAFFAGSYLRYDNPFNNYGVIQKQQYNAKIHQTVGSNGDFISVAGHYNENRSNFFGSTPLRLDPTRVVGPNGGNRFPVSKEERFYDINYPCNNNTFSPGVGVSYSDSTSGATAMCGAEFDRRYNPSNTGNIRGASRFTLMDGLVLTVDPSYQYVKANGGGAEDLREGFFTLNGVPHTGFLSGGYYYGMDLNGDGDMLDRVAGNDPSQTKTNRFGVISSLNYEINDDHRVRVAYTWDRAKHRQTGQTMLQALNGEPLDVFPINDPLVTSEGYELNKRDRKSFAILHQISGEYRGEFGGLAVQLGLRAPFFKRELNQNCYTTSAAGFLDCIPDAAKADYEAQNPYVVDPATGEVISGSARPQSRTYKYDKLLPNLGLTYDFGAASVFANYAQGLSVPGTDALYDSLYFPDVESARPAPETTDSFDLGLRYQNGSIQAQLAGWYTKYENRLARAYDPILDETIYRNLGSVDKYGVDASVAWRANRNVLLYVFGSLNDSEIKDDIATATGVLETGGKSESGSPKFMVGARGQLTFGDFEFGAQAKYTGGRYVNDENLPVYQTISSVKTAVHPAKTDGYTLVDLDVRWTITQNPFGKDVALQLNVTNLLDELYVGGFGGSLESTTVPNVQIGAPRAASISLIFGY